MRYFSFSHDFWDALYTPYKSNPDTGERNSDCALDLVSMKM